LFLTLVIVPVMYTVFDKLVARLQKNKEQKTIEQQLTEPYATEQHGH
jgi:HAE1 family hydrophobic/amphiphilic exporter-1